MSSGSPSPRTTWTALPSSVDEPMTAKPDPSPRPPLYAGGSDGAPGRGGEDQSKGPTIHRPSSLPLASSNHQIHSPPGSRAPCTVPSGRSVTWRRVSSSRSHAYSSHLPPALEAYRSRSGRSRAHEGKET